LKKLMLVAAMLAMVLAVAAPALAQFGGNDQSQYQYNQQESGDVTTGGVSATGGDGSIVQQCAAVLNQVNTGNQSNQQAAQQYQYQPQEDVVTDGVIGAGDEAVTEEVDGVEQQENAGYQYINQESDQSIAFDADQQQYCANVVAQANNNAVNTTTTTPGTTSTTTTITRGGGASGGGASGGGGGVTATVLPATGGASLLALGAGALLVAGGLVARRIVR
jgi:hypothetical protein